MKGKTQIGICERAAGCEGDEFLEEMAQRDCRALQMQSKICFLEHTLSLKKDCCIHKQLPGQKNGPEMHERSHGLSWTHFSAVKCTAARWSENLSDTGQQCHRHVGAHVGVTEMPQAVRAGWTAGQLSVGPPSRMCSCVAGGLRSSAAGRQPPALWIGHLPQGPREATSKSEQSQLLEQHLPVPSGLSQSLPLSPAIPPARLTLYFHRLLPQLPEYHVKCLSSTQLGILLGPAALQGVPRTVQSCPAACGQPRGPPGVLGQLHQDRGGLDGHRLHRHREAHGKASGCEEDGSQEAAEEGAAL